MQTCDWSGDTQAPPHTPADVFLTWLQVRPLEDVGGAVPVVDGDLPVVISDIGFSI